MARVLMTEDGTVVKVSTKPEGYHTWVRVKLLQTIGDNDQFTANFTANFTAKDAREFIDDLELAIKVAEGR